MQPYGIDPRRYSIQAELGRGTSGVVLKARYVPFDRIVALKVPQFKSGLDRAPQLNQFVRECQVLARLTGSPEPNIPKLHAVDSVAPDSAISVREFIDGETLEERAKSGSISLREGVACLETIGRAVARVHAIGVAHRNLHAANVLIARDRMPKLIGFGRCGPLFGHAEGVGTPAGVDIRGMQGILNWLSTVLKQPVPASVHTA